MMLLLRMETPSTSSGTRRSLPLVSRSVSSLMNFHKMNQAPATLFCVNRKPMLSFCLSLIGTIFTKFVHVGALFGLRHAMPVRHGRRASRFTMADCFSMRNSAYPRAWKVCGSVSTMLSSDMSDLPNSGTFPSFGLSGVAWPRLKNQREK